MLPDLWLYVRLAWLRTLRVAVKVWMVWQVMTGGGTYA